MKIHCITPVNRMDRIKSRLASLLKLEERRYLSLCMLEDVLRAISESESIEKFFVISPDREVINFANRAGAEIIREEQQKGVNAAVLKATNICCTYGAESILVFPADIPLLCTSDVDTIASMSGCSPSVIITPSLRLDGTNALMRTPPEAISTHYDQNSFKSHLSESFIRRVEAKLFLSRRVMLDIDTPEDVYSLLKEWSNTATHKFLCDLHKEGRLQRPSSK